MVIFPIKTKSSKKGKCFIFIFDVNSFLFRNGKSENNHYEPRNIFQTKFYEKNKYYASYWG